MRAQLLSFFSGRWALRWLFGLLLLLGAEVIAWGEAADYGLLDWLALFLIYFAFAALALDAIVRYRAHEIKSLFLMAGIFGLGRGLLLSVMPNSAEAFVLDLGLMALGAQVLVFGLAYACFRLLISGEASGPRHFLVALASGAIWGVWLRWYPELESVNIAPPTLSQALIACLGLFLLSGLAALLLPTGFNMRDEYDWLLTPYEYAAMSLILFVTLVMRSSDGYIEPIGAGIMAVLLFVLSLMLILSKNNRRIIPLLDLTPPQKPNLPGWFVLVLPLLLVGALSYNLVDTAEEPLIAQLVLRAILIFGSLWLPIISTLLGVQIMTRLTREGY